MYHCPSHRLARLATRAVSDQPELPSFDPQPCILHLGIRPAWRSGIDQSGKIASEPLCSAGNPDNVRCEARRSANHRVLPAPHHPGPPVTRLSPALSTHHYQFTYVPRSEASRRPEILSIFQPWPAATSTVGGAGKMALRWHLQILVPTLGAILGVHAEDAKISPIPDAPRWQLDSPMHLLLTSLESEALELAYTVYPLTRAAGANETEALRSAIWIRGSLVSAGRPASSEGVQNSDTIAFLSCDGQSATDVPNMLMAERPKAILLYSIDGNCCSLQGEDLVYGNIFTMAHSEEARALHDTSGAGGLRATIAGSVNATSALPGTQAQGGGNSAVAMSILYSITGLITVLFLVIIGTGAIRAHRYPERYGPRGGFGGEPRQSRAKGLARAVLETLPIVKFGDPAKPDPALELESHPSGAAPDPGMGTRPSASPAEPQAAPTRRSETPPPMSGAVPQPPEGTPTADHADTPASISADRAVPDADAGTAEEHLRCAICTEDFSVGEDVRVLPCTHKYHPPCIDPWLINISGTCPLCRLDLRPLDQHQPTPDPDHDHDHNHDPDQRQTDAVLLAPPLGTDRAANAPPTPVPHPPRGRRASRLLDLHRLRHASSVEERIAILRRHRSLQRRRQQQQQQQQQGEGGLEGGLEGEGGDLEEVSGRRRRAAAAAAAGLAARVRVRERLRVRTRRGSPAAGEG
ncbi:hypothetical protein BT67DRAFT_254699 [Trichocladium antarcticum]|uniref:RING-type E3 ubiquitin transferase n=1 Tax=Trichocladium antarcticum TaxID=1450529 RepID=A0AAN6ZF35_9PEZI|nr:hypothetical protein BT67DRAFT_254699 [Trichocladium antarcticum]